VPQPTQRFLNAYRLAAYCGTALLVFQMYGVVTTGFVSWRLYGHPDGFDFQTFWAASHLSLLGRPLAAYDYPTLVDTIRAITPHAKLPGPWFYPPTFLLLVQPFALLPSPIAYLIFATLTTALLVAIVRKVLPMPGATVWILAFPGLWLNVVQGQNAALTATLALAAFIALPKRPRLAGVCIGLLAIKPHLAILFPLVLACAGMWTAFAFAALTAALFAAVSVAVFGLDIVPVFLHGLAQANAMVANGDLPWDQMATLFAGLRMLGVPASTAYLAQACQAILAIAAAAWVWRHSTALEVRATALVGATFLISPYLYNYDAVWLAIPLALLTAKAMRDGWLRGERALLAVAFLYPQVGNECGRLLGLCFGPLLFAALLGLAMRRTWLTMRATRTPEHADHAVRLDPALDRR
jgi:hypothetical protein